MRKLRRSLLRLLVRPPLRAIAAPTYAAVVAVELAAHRAADALAAAPEGSLADLTVLVKTFERPEALRRLVASVRRLHPSVRVLVVDDSREPSRLEGVETLVLPYRSGVAAGRNAGLARVETPFFLLADDDFVFFRGTRLAPVVERMRAHAELDLVGGRVIDLPHHGERNTSARAIGSRGEPPVEGTVAGLERREVVSNFFVGRTERVREVGWDPELRVVEHADFFGRARGRLCVAFDPELAVLHAMTPFDEAYMRHRLAVGPDLERLARKWGTGSGRPPGA